MATFDVLQTATAGNSGPDAGASSISLASAPTAGSLLVIIAGQRSHEHTTINVPSGWTMLGGYSRTDGVASKGVAILAKIATGSETTVTFDNASPTHGAPESALYVELEYADDALPELVDEDGVTFDDDTTPTFGTVATAAGPDTLVLAIQWKQPATPDPGPQTLSGFAVLDDSEYASLGNRHRLTAWYVVDDAGGTFGGGTLSAATDGTEDGLVYLAALEAAIPPTDPPEPDTPPYTIPAVAGPLIEIWVADADSFRWGGAQWDEATWGESGWVDVTPQGVTIDVAWGADDAAAGILTRPQSGVWTIQTYDPDRKLDPINDGSPFWPEIVPGLPIRISHRSVVMRTGIVETVDYEYADHIGRIRATDAGAAMQAIVPADSILSDTVYDRIADAIAAAGVDVELAADSHDATVSAQPDGELTAWEHALNVAEERPRVLWIDRDNRIRLRRWGSPLERGRELLATNLVNLRVTLDDGARYSVVRALDEDGVTTFERAETPTPRYGQRIYERTRTTIDSDDWATMILADRATPGVAYRPGDVVCFDADDVEYYGTIEGGELVTIDTDEIGAVQGIVLGGRFRVVHRGGQTPVWRFTFQVHQTGYVGLVHDVTGEPLVDDDDADSYLIAD